MKTYKSRIRTITIVALVLLLFTTAYAKETPSIEIGKVVGTSGESIVVPITISNNPGIVLASFTIEYDEDYLTLLSVDDTDDFKHNEDRNKNYRSPYIVDWVNEDWNQNVMSDGTMVNLMFHISEDAPAGQHKIQLKSIVDGVLNASNEVVDSSMIDGCITVETHIHKWTAWEKYNSKLHYHVCQDCEGEIEYEEHNWDAGAITTEATETSKGIKTYTCVDCSETELWYYSWAPEEPEKPSIPSKPTSTPSKPATIYTCPYTDISNHWANDIIRYIDKLGLMDGMTATTFAPDKPMTREAFVIAMARLSSVESNYIGWAIDSGLLKGYGNGEYGLKDTITREQMAVFFLRFLELSEIDYEDCKTVAPYKFADDNQIADWAEKAVYEMQALDLIHGKGNRIFDPKGLTTRAEGATVLYNLCKIVLNK